MKKKLPWDEWFEKASQVRTIDQFKELYDYLFNGNICHTYDSAVHATSALALAGGHLGSSTEGITGFQASFVKFDWLREWDGYGKDTGCIKVIDFDNLCYPQYVKNYKGMDIPLGVWKSVQKACVRKLNECEYPNTACWRVREYWGDVAKGIIPPTLRVVDEDEKTLIKSVAPMCVTRPTHTIADMEYDYSDSTSPWYDKARDEEEYRKWKEEMDSKYNSCGG